GPDPPGRPTEPDVPQDGSGSWPAARARSCGPVARSVLAPPSVRPRPAPPAGAPARAGRLAVDRNRCAGNGRRSAASACPSRPFDGAVRRMGLFGIAQPGAQLSGQGGQLDGQALTNQRAHAHFAHHEGAGPQRFAVLQIRLAPPADEAQHPAALIAGAEDAAAFRRGAPGRQEGVPLGGLQTGAPQPRQRKGGGRLGFAEGGHLETRRFGREAGLCHGTIGTEAASSRLDLRQGRVEAAVPVCCRLLLENRHELDLAYDPDPWRGGRRHPEAAG
uniref:Transcriptional regulator n=1 Tax=Parastrongyloides trichosuri TaxID=131310 RepID=A0A0N4ZLH5_PARTI